MATPIDLHFVPSLALSLVLCACRAGASDGADDLSSTATDDGPATTGDDATATTTSSDESPSEGSSGGDDAVGSDATGGTDGGGPSLCAETCTVAADCSLPIGGPDDWACADGFCVYTRPPCDPTQCDDVGSGVCAEVDGSSVCGTPCPVGDECTAPLQCTGMDPAGNPFCAPPPQQPCNGIAEEGEPCDVVGFGQVGVCADGVCSCSSDAECTVAEQACRL